LHRDKGLEAHQRKRTYWKKQGKRVTFNKARNP